MKLTVGTAVRDAVADPQTEELAFRVIATLPTNELLIRVRAALTVFEREWDRDAPLVDSDGPVPAPDYAVSTAAPDVIVSLIKLTDLRLSFERVSAAIFIELAGAVEHVRIDRPKRSRINLDTPVAMLNLRLALQGHWLNEAMFEVDADPDLIESHRVRWTRELNPAGQLHLQRPDFRFTPIAQGSESDTLRELRDHQFTCLLGVHGDTIRGTATWNPHGWLSILSGTTALATFDWREHWQLIEPLFRAFEPFTETAILCHAFFLTENGVVTHGNRQPQLTPSRNAAPHIARRNEDHGLVDADGRFFKTGPLPALPATWQQSRYGHLTQVDAPNIDDWLQHRPDTHVLQQGRTDLAPLLEPT